MSVIEAVADFTDVLAGKTKDVEFMKEGSTPFFLLFEETEYHRAKSPRTGVGNTQFTAKTLRLPLARAKAIALFAIVGIDKKTTFVKAQGIQHSFDQCV